MDVRSYFESEKPKVLFVANDSENVRMYFKDDDEYVELIVSCKYNYGWGSSGHTITVKANRSSTFDFEINPFGQFFVSKEKTLAFGKAVSYNRGSTSPGRGEVMTNLFVISDSSFGLTEKLQNVMHPELIDSLEDEVAEGLLSNSQFSEVEKYERDILTQLAS